MNIYRIAGKIIPCGIKLLPTGTTLSNANRKRWNSDYQQLYKFEGKLAAGDPNVISICSAETNENMFLEIMQHSEFSIAVFDKENNSY